jgi:hypothetical protein
METDMDDLPCYGVNRRRLDQIFRNLGGQITTPNRTGEVRYWHPVIRHYATANGRRIDAPRFLVRYVREVMRLLKAQAHQDART